MTIKQMRRISSSKLFVIGIQESPVFQLEMQQLFFDNEDTLMAQIEDGISDPKTGGLKLILNMEETVALFLELDKYMREYTESSSSVAGLFEEKE